MHTPLPRLAAAFLIFGAACLLALSASKPAPQLHTIAVPAGKKMVDFFAYAPDRLPFVSAHRGGPRAGFPENCIATFENTLSKTHAILEIDPHYTRDSAIVLMHDATLERTSNGTGKVSDHTLAEIRQFKLKDIEGKLTPHGIPTLGEVLDWAKGRTIMVLDMKDVPIEARVREIVIHKAENHAIVMAYNNADAKKCYALNKQIVMEVMLGSMEKVREFDETGVPWKNVVVFVSHALVKDRVIFDEIHRRGAMCIVGSSRNYDVDFMKGNIASPAILNENYRSMITGGADLIEADLAIEAGMALEPLREAKSSKSVYFK